MVTGWEADPAAPASFAWRGRVYVVREVLGRWLERTSWWRRIVEVAAEQDRRDLADLGRDEPSLPAPLVETADLEEQVWRVLASPGRGRAVGVYDVAHGRGWRLLRMSD